MTTRAASPLLLLCVAQFVLQLDFSIVNIALRTIAGELHFSAVSLQWVVTGYALSFGSLLLLGGRLGDVLGRRRLLLGGLWLFGAASVACGLASSPVMLVAARFVQGIGAALMAPSIIAMLTAIYADGPARTRALGLWTAATAAGGVSGIVAGGVLTQYLGWRSIFLVNIPVIAVLLPVARRVLPEVPGDRSRKLDALGATTVTIAIGALIFGLSNGEQHGFASTGSLLAFGIFVVFAVAFVVIERTVAAPMLPFSFLAVGIRRVSFVVMLVVGGVFAAYAYFVALYLQRVLGYSEIQAAVALVPAPATLVVGSTLVSRRAIARLGVKTTMLAGLVSLAAGQLVLEPPDRRQRLPHAGAARADPHPLRRRARVPGGLGRHDERRDGGGPWPCGRAHPDGPAGRRRDLPRGAGHDRREHDPAQRVARRRVPDVVSRRGGVHRGDGGVRRVQRDATRLG